MTGDDVSLAEDESLARVGNSEIEEALNYAIGTLELRLEKERSETYQGHRLLYKLYKKSLIDTEYEVFNDIWHAPISGTYEIQVENSRTVLRDLRQGEPLKIRRRNDNW